MSDDPIIASHDKSGPPKKVPPVQIFLNISTEGRFLQWSSYLAIWLHCQYCMFVNIAHLFELWVMHHLSYIVSKCSPFSL